MLEANKGLELLEEVCRNKDNAISLATIRLTNGNNGLVNPAVRDVSAYYEDGIFYVTTHAKSNKILEIEENENVAFGVHFEGISGNAVAKNLGWVMKPENAELRLKLRKIFEPWYDHANNEKDVNCCILAVKVTRVRVFRNEGTINEEYFI